MVLGGVDGWASEYHLRTDLCCACRASSGGEVGDVLVGRAAEWV